MHPLSDVPDRLLESNGGIPVLSKLRESARAASRGQRINDEPNPRIGVVNFFTAGRLAAVGRVQVNKEMSR
jgi:hypothetical protein